MTAGLAVKSQPAPQVLIERDRCPGCDSAHFKPIFREPFASPRMAAFFARKFVDPQLVLSLLGDSEYELDECRHCRLIFQRRILTDEYLGKLYDEWLAQNDAERELSRVHLPLSELSQFANEIAMIGRLLRRPAHETSLLDYGMGEGWWCRVAASLGHRVTGTDLATNLVEKAYGFNAISMQELPKHRFDFINTEQVFEHLARPLETLRHLRGSLNKGGLLKISVPNGASIPRRLSKMDWTAPRTSKPFLMEATPLIHINSFRLSSIEAMGQQAGFTPVPLSPRAHYALINVTTPKDAIKSLARPIYRWLTRHTYMILRAA
jgi:2-polyprenyl-3-methyl-5-hydroxy-6-metoxy-1,4-benzoquinol methylase